MHNSHRLLFAVQSSDAERSKFIQAELMRYAERRHVKTQIVPLHPGQRGATVLPESKLVVVVGPQLARSQRGVLDIHDDTKAFLAQVRRSMFDLFISILGKDEGDGSGEWIANPKLAQMSVPIDSEKDYREILNVLERNAFTQIDEVKRSIDFRESAVSLVTAPT